APPFNHPPIHPPGSLTCVRTYASRHSPTTTIHLRRDVAATAQDGPVARNNAPILSSTPAAARAISSVSRKRPAFARRWTAIVELLTLAARLPATLSLHFGPLRT